MFVFCRLMTTDCTIGDHEKKKNTNSIGSTNSRFASPPPRYHVSGERRTFRLPGTAASDGADASAGRSSVVKVIRVCPLWGRMLRPDRRGAGRSIRDHESS